jgi:hypothetical protein
MFGFKCEIGFVATSDGFEEILQLTVCVRVEYSLA